MAASSAAATDVRTSERELVIARVFDAPRELLFDAWTERRHLECWWGPDGFRTTTHEIAVRPGGVWRFTMHAPDGTDFGNTIVFVEIVRPERLVYRHAGEGETADVRFETTITFEAQGRKTLLTMRSLFESPSVMNRVVEKYGAVEGGKQHLARLAEFVAGLGGEAR
jgi:uncharacterized protein YndB with AHSA1/START domain